VTGVQTCALPISTPTYNADGQPTYTGVATEGVYNCDILVLGIGSQIATDTRGKLCFSNATNGTVKIAERGTYNKGYKPASGCKVRIPNVILSSADVIDYDRNITSGRYAITTTAAAGSIDFKKVQSNWSIGVINCFSVSVLDSASNSITFSNVGSAVTFLRNGIGVTRATGVGAAFTNCFVGGDVSNNVGFGKNTYPLTITGCQNFTVDENRLYNSGSRLGRYVKSAQAILYLTESQNITLDGNIQIGGEITVGDCVDIEITNAKYSDVLTGETTAALTGYVYNLGGAVNVTIEGLEIFDGITNVHPETAILTTGNYCSNIKMRNIGSIATPFNGGSVAANQMNRIVFLQNATTNVELQRIYCQNLRATVQVINDLNTIKNIRAINVWGDGTSAALTRGIDRISQGCKWTQSTTAYAAVYGSHWEDAFISTTEGRLIIFGNEPSAATAAQCTASFGTNAGFTSAGSASPTHTQSDTPP
jgi:hypothetical protein